MTPVDTATASLVPSAADGSSASSHLLPPALAAVLLQVQAVHLMQIEAMISWQRSSLAVAQELWDQWVCHFGGGAPIGA